jgi:lactococcin 972 family bacteriocin
MGKLMKKRFGIIGVTIAAALIALPATAASAATVHPKEGGLWDYGVSDGNVYSSYYHATKDHTATACNGGLIDACHKAVATKKHWAKAKNIQSYTGGNKAYYSIVK